jgi:hypothetical protein
MVALRTKIELLSLPSPPQLVKIKQQTVLTTTTFLAGFFLRMSIALKSIPPATENKAKIGNI